MLYIHAIDCKIHIKYIKLIKYKHMAINAQWLSSGHHIGDTKRMPEYTEFESINFGYFIFKNA